MLEWQAIMVDAHASVMAFDFGTQKIGVAVGQPFLQSATPLPLVATRDGIPAWPEVLALLAEWKVTLCVVGLPLNMDDTESDLCARARKFARRLAHFSQLKTVMVDERLTSFSARGLVRDIKQQRKGRTPRLDSLAAVVLLESFFEHNQGVAP